MEAIYILTADVNGVWQATFGSHEEHSGIFPISGVYGYGSNPTAAIKSLEETAAQLAVVAEETKPF